MTSSRNVVWQVEHSFAALRSTWQAVQLAMLARGTASTSALVSSPTWQAEHSSPRLGVALVREQDVAADGAAVRGLHLGALEELRDALFLGFFRVDLGVAQVALRQHGDRRSATGVARQVAVLAGHAFVGDVLGVAETRSAAATARGPRRACNPRASRVRSRRPRTWR
jgi:hypothetical protein